MTKNPKRPTRRTERQSRPLLIAWIVGGLLIAGAVVYALMLAGPTPPNRLTLAGGAPGGAYHVFAERYQRALAAEGVTVDVIDTAGSIENLELLSSGRADVAFVQSGTQHAVDEPERLRGIASLYYEPLWIFRKGDGSIDGLGELLGKRLAIGAARSGTNAVAKQLLSLNGVDASNTDLRELEPRAAADALNQGEVDFAFFISSPQAEVVKELIVAPDTRLVGIRRHRAYVRNVLFVTDLEIAEGTFDLRQNFPREDIVVLSTLACLVCNKDLHPALVELLARTARELHSGRQLLERGGEFPTPDNLEYAVHEAAFDYFQSGPSLLARYMPFWLATLLKRIALLAIPLLTLLIPLLKIAPIAYKAIMRRRIHLFYNDVDQIESALLDAKSAEDFDRYARELDQLLHDVEVGIEVPTSFRHEEYDLRLHLAQVRQRLDQARERVLGTGA